MLRKCTEKIAKCLKKKWKNNGNSPVNYSIVYIKNKLYVLLNQEI